MSRELLQTRPVARTGTPIGYLDWNISFEIALPAEGASTYGTDVYGTAVYSLIAWQSLTESVRGVNWQRGSDSPGDRPRTGFATLQLDNRDRAWTPWLDEPMAVYRGPGTLIRWTCHSPDSWIPQFAGIVEEWIEQTDGASNENVVLITLQETVGTLGGIDNNTTTSGGAGSLAAGRVQRLLDAAGWIYGFFDEAESNVPLQATDMSLNRLAELHLTADSTDSWFRSHRSGLAMLERVDPYDHPEYNFPTAARYGTSLYGTGLYGVDFTNTWSTMRHASFWFSGITLSPWAPATSAADGTGRVAVTIAYNLDSLVPLNDLDYVRNDIRLANEGGVVQVAQNTISMGRYGQHTLARLNLKTQSATQVLAIAQAIRARREYTVLRVESVQVFSRPGNLFPQVVIDLGDQVTVVLPDNTLEVFGHISHLEHSITPLSRSGVVWESTIGLETYPGFV